MTKIVYFILTLIIALILSYPQTTNGNIDGSPGAKTNSPADGNNCTGCHNGNINTGPGGISITSNIPSTRQLDIRLHKKIIVCEHCGRILVDSNILSTKK